MNNKPMDFRPDWFQAAEAATEIGAEDKYDDCVPEGACIAVFYIALIALIAAASFFAYVY